MAQISFWSNFQSHYILCVCHFWFVKRTMRARAGTYIKLLLCIKFASVYKLIFQYKMIYYIKLCYSSHSVAATSYKRMSIEHILWAVKALRASEWVSERNLYLFIVCVCINNGRCDVPVVHCCYFYCHRYLFYEFFSISFLPTCTHYHMILPGNLGPHCLV